jgi:hypothetical protein
MPNKRNAPRRHRIPKMKFRVKNWAEYNIAAGRGLLGPRPIHATMPMG